MGIAVVVTGGVSETILATPLLGTLREGRRDEHLTLLCPEVATAVAQGVHTADEAVPLRGLNGAPSASSAMRVWWELRRRRLDAVLLCSRSWRVAFAAYLSGTPQRVGLSGAGSRALLTAAAAPVPGENLARSWLRMASKLGVRTELHKPAYEPGADARRHADELINNSPIADGRLLIAIAPGTALAANPPEDAWEPERFAHLANQLGVRHGAGIVLVGAQADRAAIELTMLDLAAPMADLSAAGDPATIAAVLARCDLLIGADTPLLHLAAAVGTPTVGLFSGTDGIRRGPYGADHRVIQALARRPVGTDRHAVNAPLLGQIRVEDVLASIEST